MKIIWTFVTLCGALVALLLALNTPAANVVLGVLLGFMAMFGALVILIAYRPEPPPRHTSHQIAQRSQSPRIEYHTHYHVHGVGQPQATLDVPAQRVVQLSGPARYIGR